MKLVHLWSELKIAIFGRPAPTLVVFMGEESYPSKKSSDNPFREGTDEHEDWKRGYQKRKFEEQSAIRSMYGSQH